MEITKSTMKKLLFLITFAVLLVSLFQHFQSFKGVFNVAMDVLMPFLIGLFIAFIVNVLMSGIENKLFAPLNKRNNKIWNRLKRPLALILSFLVIIGLFAFLILLLIPEVKNTSAIIADSFPAYLEKVQNWLAAIMEKYNLSSESLKSLEINWEKVQDVFTNFLKNGGTSVINGTIGLTTSIVSGVFNFVLGLVFSAYVLLQKEKLSYQCKRILYSYLPKAKIDSFLRVCSLSHKTFTNFVSGQCLEAVIIGVLCFIGMLIFKIPYAPLISALVGFTALIPVFGAFVGTGVGAFLILMVSPIKALWFIVFILVLQQLEGDLIYPKVVGKSVGLPGIWVLVAVTAGGSLYGVMGMLLSVPIASIVYVLLRDSTAKRLETRNIKI
ncbi:MAG: AI-2E family transporter [Oscillospiraceae bacterium]